MASCKGRKQGHGARVARSRSATEARILDAALEVFTGSDVSKIDDLVAATTATNLSMTASLPS